ncbi:hypothetical protein E2C01_038035 [Portunus trituberculatus]|uniref:Uncharacterized protein n=1 Tax=Portunus trituberculatus TaxID=210409 RepID=A0A5B7FD35_PORTR|nr:hypothetical protein [Portunus trituberculatus]
MRRITKYSEFTVYITRDSTAHREITLKLRITYCYGEAEDDLTDAPKITNAPRTKGPTRVSLRQVDSHRVRHNDHQHQ